MPPPSSFPPDEETGILDRQLNELLSRIDALGISIHDLNPKIEKHFRMLQAQAEMGVSDPELYHVLNHEISQLEPDPLDDNKFVEPPPHAGISYGSSTIAHTLEGQPYAIDYLLGLKRFVGHIVLAGITGIGKTILLGLILAAAAGSCGTLALDTNRTFRPHVPMRRTHRWLLEKHFRYNPWGNIDGVNPHVIDASVNHEIASNCHLIYGEFELNEACREIRAKGEVPNINSIIRTLQAKKFPFGSRRNNYRDSACLVLDNLRTTLPWLVCEQGFDLRDLLQKNTVLEIEGLPEHVAMLSRFLLVGAYFISISGVPLERPVRLAIDELQIVSQLEGFGSMILDMRHNRIYLCGGFQNFSKAPIEIRGNADLVVSFLQTEKADRQAFAQLANLNPAQEEALSRLDQATCVLYAPRSKWKYPVLAKVEHVELIQE